MVTLTIALECQRQRQLGIATKELKRKRLKQRETRMKDFQRFGFAGDFLWERSDQEM
jgi:hypothetical protein